MSTKIDILHIEGDNPVELHIYFDSEIPSGAGLDIKMDNKTYHLDLPQDTAEYLASLLLSKGLQDE